MYTGQLHKSVCGSYDNKHKICAFSTQIKSLHDEKRGTKSNPYQISYCHFLASGSGESVFSKTMTLPVDRHTQTRIFWQQEFLLMGKKKITQC